MYKNIVVAVDGSPTSELALNEATKLAAPGVAFTVLIVVEDPAWNFALEYSVAYDIEQLRNAVIEGATKTLDKARQLLADKGIEARTELKDLTLSPGQNVPPAILEEAEALGADLLVIGTHGRRGFNRLLMGSVAEQVLRLSTLPVLLVRAQEKKEEKPQPFSDFPAEELMGS